MVTVLCLDIITSAPGGARRAPCIAGRGSACWTRRSASLPRSVAGRDRRKRMNCLGPGVCRAAYYYEHKPALDEDLRADLPGQGAEGTTRWQQAPFLFV